MPMNNLVEYSNYFSKSGSLWEYHEDYPSYIIIDFESFKFKIKMEGTTPAAGNTMDAKITVPLKYLSNFLGNFEMPLINCEINLILTLSENCVIMTSTGAGTFEITNTKLCSPEITLPTQDSTKLLQ